MRIAANLESRHYSNELTAFNWDIPKTFAILQNRTLEQSDTMGVSPWSFICFPYVMPVPDKNLRGLTPAGIHFKHT
jgi:hypothetical protein